MAKTKEELFDIIFDAARGTAEQFAANDHERMALIRYMRTALARYTRNELTDKRIFDDVAALLVQAQRGYRDFMAKRGRPVRARDKQEARQKSAIDALRRAQELYKDRPS